MSLGDCTFCSNNIQPGSGVLYVRRNGDTFNFCSSKCRRNMLGLKRVNRYTRWTQTARDLKAQK